MYYVYENAHAKNCDARTRATKDGIVGIVILISQRYSTAVL